MKTAGPTRPLWFVVVATSVVAGLAGFIIGRSDFCSSSSQPKSENALAQNSSQKSFSQTASSRSPHGEKRIARNTPGRGSGFSDTMQKALAETNEIRRHHALHGVVLSLEPADIPAALEQAELLQGGDALILRRLLAARWAEADPRTAADYALSRRNVYHDGLIEDVLKVWVAQDPGAAIAWTNTLPLGIIRAELERTVHQQLFRVDPAKAFEFTKTVPGYALRYGEQLFRSWAERDPNAAANAALSLPLRARDSALTAVAGSWARRDAPAALAWVQQLPDAQSRKFALTSAIAAWAKTDEGAALAYARGLGPGQERDEAMQVTISVIGQHDSETAIKLLSELPPALQDDALGRLASGVSQRDATKAAGYVQMMSAGGKRDRAAIDVTLQWARDEPVQAAAWLRQLPPGSNLDTSLQTLAQQWSKIDPKAAAEWFAQNTDWKAKGRDLAWIVGSWATDNAAEALAWVQRLPADEVRDSLMTISVAWLAETDPQKAISSLNNISSDVVKNRTAGAIATHLAWKDPAATAQWAATLNDGSRIAAFSSIAHAWVQQNPAEAAEWLKQLPGGAARDAAILQFATMAVSKDPEAALAWAATLADSKQRQSEMEKLARTWLEQNEKAARQWVSSTNAFPIDVKQRLLQTP